jgi:hypothetical protein
MTLLEAATYFSARLDRLQGISSNNSGGSGSGGGVRVSTAGTGGGVSAGNGGGGGGGVVMVNRWATPPGAKGNAGVLSTSSSSSMSIAPAAAAGGGGVLAPMHPSEPTVSSLGHLAGCMLHAFGVKASMTGTDISNAIGIQGLTVRRLDDHNVLIIHESLGKARRTLESYEMSVRRGVMIPFKLRWWGVGTERLVRSM